MKYFVVGCHCETEDGQRPKGDTGTQGKGTAEAGQRQTHRGDYNGDIIDCLTHRACIMT